MGEGEDDINWESLQNLQQGFFSTDVSLASAVVRGASAKRQKTQKKRLVWPCEMIAVVDQVSVACNDHFDACLELAGGHVVLWAWYLALFRALRSGASSLVNLASAPGQASLMT